MAVLVTGAAGFIGSHVARRLLDGGFEVVGTDNLDDAYDAALKKARLASLQSLGMRHVAADLRDSDALAGVIRQHSPDVIYHLAARAGVRASLEDPALYADVNLGGTTKLLEAARKHDVETVVMASTSSVYGRHEDGAFVESDDTSHPMSPYAASKKGAEVMCAAFSDIYGLNTPVTRFFTVYGPAGRPDMSVFRFIEWCLQGQPLQVYGDGEQRRDFTFVEDIARGVIAASNLRGHDTINLGGGEPASLKDVISLIGHHCGREPVVDYGPTAAGDVPATWADIQKARDMLGWMPEVDLATGIGATVKWHKERR